MTERIIENESIENDSISYNSIDPGYVNFSISNINSKINFLVNFSTLDCFEEQFAHFFIFYMTECIPKFCPNTAFKKYIFNIENQHKIRNKSIQYFIIGSLGMYAKLNNLVFEINSIPATFKNYIAQDKFQWEYQKIKTIKAFDLLKTTHSHFFDFLTLDWKCIKCDHNDKRNIFKNIKELKKYDDYIDTRLLLFYNKDLHQKQRKNKKLGIKSKRLNRFKIRKQKRKQPTQKTNKKIQNKIDKKKKNTKAPKTRNSVIITS